MYLNKALIIGNLTRDPELKALPSGIKVCSFGVATNRSYKDKDGNRQETTEFHNVVAFAKLGELAAQYLRKGSQVYIEGRLQTRSWEDKEGAGKKYRTEIIADTVQFGNRPGGAGAGSNPSASTAKGGAEQPDTPADKIDYPSEEINPDDIPF
jgi:single-strand DNA-binding protein